MRPITIALLTLLTACTMDVEEADARCRIIGGKLTDSTPVEEARWFQKNCACDDLNVGLRQAFEGLGLPLGRPGDACVAPGSKRAAALALAVKERQEEQKKLEKRNEERRKEEESKATDRVLGTAAGYVEEGQFDTALKSVLAVLSSPTASLRQKAFAHALNGTILFARGKTTEGESEEKQALDLEPTDREIQKQVARRKLAGFGGGDQGRKDGRKVSIQGGQIVALGAIDKDLFRRVLQEKGASQFRFCYEYQLAVNSKLAGAVAIKWVIDADGNASNATVDTGSTTLVNDKLHQCMMARIVSWQFPKPKGGGIAVITYPWILSSSGGAGG